jgi:hypothetical protein
MLGSIQLKMIHSSRIAAFDEALNFDYGDPLSPLWRLTSDWQFRICERNIEKRPGIAGATSTQRGNI